VRAIVFDVSDTLVGPHGLVDGVPELWDFCAQHAIKRFVAATHPSDIGRLHAHGIWEDGGFAGRDRGVTINKGSTEFVTRPAREAGVALSDIIYVGDNDKTDARTAANARVPYFRATWAHPHGQAGKYGIPVSSVRALMDYISLYLLKQRLWYWGTSGHDARGRPFSYRAVADCLSINATWAQSHFAVIATSVLKDKDNTSPYRRYLPFFQHQLLSSLYLANWAQESDLWAVVPGHTTTSHVHPVLSPLVKEASTLSRHRPAELLVRHATVPSSREEKNRRQIPRFDKHVRSIHLNPDYKGILQGKRILLADDFITDGKTSEWCRNLLLAGGAGDVLCVAVGKFPTNSFGIWAPRPGVSFDPFIPVTLSDDDFERTWASQDKDASAQAELLVAFDMFEKTL
jgi:hypothetical protein